MNAILRRALQAYRPLYLRGQLMDGPCRWPSADAAHEAQQTAAARRPRQRMLLAAMASVHTYFVKRSKS